MPRKKTCEGKEVQITKMKPDLLTMKESFQHKHFCPYLVAPSSQLPYVLLAMKYMKLHQRKKQPEIPCNTKSL